jgi:membrane protein
MNVPQDSDRKASAAGPSHFVALSARTLGRALGRLWGRDVMLFTGGVSFFAMLAIFPAIAIAFGVYSVMSDPIQAAHQGDALSRMLPEAARAIFQAELLSLAHAPEDEVSIQSGFALLIGGYAAHRGFKALLAGLSFIHEEDQPRGFLGFNLMALIVLIAAFAMLAIVSTLFFGLQIMGETFGLRPLRGVAWFFSEWTWGSAGVILGLSLIYRFAMSRRPVDWRASVLGAVSAAGLCLFASWGIAFYLEQLGRLGATYGSVATAVAFLIWLSWNVNAVFFGGALATEVELVIEASSPGS